MPLLWFYINPVSVPYSSVLNKPANPEPLYYLKALGTECFACMDVILLLICNIIPAHWGSEIRPFEIQTFWGSDFKWSSFQMIGLHLWLMLQSQAFRNWTIKIWTFSWFQMVLTKWRPFVQISIGWGSGLQICIICNHFWPFEIQTGPDFKSPLYLTFQE